MIDSPPSCALTSFSANIPRSPPEKFVRSVFIFTHVIGTRGDSSARLQFRVEFLSSAAIVFFSSSCSDGQRADSVALANSDGGAGSHVDGGSGGSRELLHVAGAAAALHDRVLPGPRAARALVRARRAKQRALRARLASAAAAPLIEHLPGGARGRGSRAAPALRAHVPRIPLPHRAAQLLRRVRALQRAARHRPVHSPVPHDRLLGRCASARALLQL